MISTMHTARRFPTSKSIVAPGLFQKRPGAFFIAIGIGVCYDTYKGGDGMEIRFVTPDSEDFRLLAAELDAYYFSLVGDIQNRYAGVNRPENMNALAVVYADEAPIAIGAWKRVDEKTAEIKRIYVRPAYRRQRVASRLILALEDSAVAAGFRQFILETARNTDSSHQLYFSLGYTIIDYYGSPAGAENCLCFYKER